MLFAWLEALIWWGFSSSVRRMTDFSGGWRVPWMIFPKGAFGQSDFGSQESRDP